MAQILSKISQIEAYNSLYSHDFICISETYFDSTILEGNKSLHLNGYNLLRADHPNNTKQEVFALVELSNLSQCVICEVSLQNCKGYTGVVCRSSSQDSTEFENFLSGFDELLRKTASSNYLFTIILDDFNARSSS